MKAIKILILKFLGFDDASILYLRTELGDIKTTISTLKDEATEISRKNELAYLIIKDLGIDSKDELWWEKSDMHSISPERYPIAVQIRNGAMVGWVVRHAAVKEKKGFHGGCLNCVTPLEDGIGKCLGCQYMTADWSLPDLSRNTDVPSIK